MIVIDRHGIYELPHELPNNLKLNLPSAQSSCQTDNLFNASQKLLKIRY